MATASAAHNLGTLHAVTVVFVELKMFLFCRLPKTWPAAAGFILGIGGKKLVAAGHAYVRARLFRSVVLPRKRSFRAFLPSDFVLLRRENFSPLLIRFCYFINIWYNYVMTSKKQSLIKSIIERLQRIQKKEAQIVGLKERQKLITK